MVRTRHDGERKLFYKTPKSASWTAFTVDPSPGIRSLQNPGRILKQVKRTPRQLTVRSERIIQNFLDEMLTLQRQLSPENKWKHDLIQLLESPFTRSRSKTERLTVVDVDHWLQNAQFAEAMQKLNQGELSPSVEGPPEVRSPSTQSVAEVISPPGSFVSGLDSPPYLGPPSSISSDESHCFEESPEEREMTLFKSQLPDLKVIKMEQDYDVDNNQEEDDPWFSYSNEPCDENLPTEQLPKVDCQSLEPDPVPTRDASQLQMVVWDPVFTAAQQTAGTSNSHNVLVNMCKMMVHFEGAIGILNTMEPMDCSNPENLESFRYMLQGTADFLSTRLIEPEAELALQKWHQKNSQ